MTTGMIVGEVLKTQKLGNWQETHIETLLLCSHYSDEDMIALSRLTEAMIAGSIERTH